MSFLQIARLFKRFLILDLEYTFEYKKETISNLLFYLLEAVVWIFFWQVIFSQTSNSLGEWSLNDCFALVGMASLFLGIWASFFLAPSILDHIVVDSGLLEKYLIHPVDTYWALIGERFQFRNTGPQIVSGLIIIALSSISVGFIPSIINLILAIVVLLLGILILTFFFGTMNCIVFWIPKANFVDFFHTFFEFLRFPTNSLPSGVKHILTLGIPIMFLATIPTQVYLGRLHFIDILTFIGIELILLSFWSLIFSFLWKKGLKRYQSYGG